MRGEGKRSKPEKKAKLIEKSTVKLKKKLDTCKNKRTVAHRRRTQYTICSTRQNAAI